MGTVADRWSAEFDEDYFLKEPTRWSEALAEEIARHDGLARLTDAQWAVIKSLRRHYFERGSVPMLRHICHLNHLDKRCMDTLFLHGPKEAWRIAGLPNPGEEAKSYM